MFTIQQVKDIGYYYVYRLYAISAKYLGEEEVGVDTLTNGQCYYYASALADILQGRWRNVDVSSLSEEEKKQRWQEIGKIITYTGDHYLVEYNGQTYDGHGADFVEANAQYLETDSYANNKACFCQSDWKAAIWKVYNIGYKAVEEDFLRELYDPANADDNKIYLIVRRYFDKSLKALNEAARLVKTDDGYEIGEATKIKLEDFKTTPEKLLETYQELEKYGHNQVLSYKPNKPKKEDN